MLDFPFELLPTSWVFIRRSLWGSLVSSIFRPVVIKAQNEGLVGAGPDYYRLCTFLRRQCTECFLPRSQQDLRGRGRANVFHPEFCVWDSVERTSGTNSGPPGRDLQWSDTLRQWGLLQHSNFHNPLSYLCHADMILAHWPVWLLALWMWSGELLFELLSQSRVWPIWPTWKAELPIRSLLLWIRVWSLLTRSTAQNFKTNRIS